MKLLTKSQSFDNIIRDTEEQIEKAITDYLNDMTVDDLDKVVKNNDGLGLILAPLKLNGITKTDNLFWFHFTDATFGLSNWSYSVDQFSLQDKRQLLKLIEETI